MISTRDRKLLEQLVKSWAQDHNVNYRIADFNAGESALTNTGSHFNWIIRNGEADIDLLGLVDRLEVFLENRKRRKHPDGMYCKKCQSFYQYAEPNQEDGSLICYGCRNP